MTNELLKKLRGYQKASRDRFFLLTEGVLNHEEFIVYEFCIAITDWDRSHSTYGSFDATNKDIAEILNWRRDSTVSRHRSNLIKKGILLPTPDNRTRVFDFEQWQRNKPPTKTSDSNSAVMQGEAAKLQQMPAFLHELSAKLQKSSPQTTNQSLVSSKGESKYSRSDSEYQKIWDERGRPADFTPEDMKWIDENVKETNPKEFYDK